MKLFVDDERPAPEGWVLAKTSSEALTILTKVHELGHTLDAISLDHDLSTVMYEDDTTRPVMLWMCEHEWWPTEVYVHTANPCGEEWLVGMTQRYAPPGTLVGYGCNFWGTCKSDSIERHLVQHRG